MSIPRGTRSFRISIDKIGSGMLFLLGLIIVAIIVSFI